MDTNEERISKCEDRSVAINHAKIQKKKWGIKQNLKRCRKIAV